MRRLEYDVDGYALYAGWAILPTASENDPVWAVARLVWDKPNGRLLDTTWADGADSFTHVYADRALLTYTSNPNLTFDLKVDIVPTGARPGHLFDAGVPLTAHNHEVLVNGQTLKRVSISPGLNEYAFSGTAFEIGLFVGGGEPIFAEDYLVVRLSL